MKTQYPVIDLIPPAVQNNAALRKMFAIPKSNFGNVVAGAVILGYPKNRYQRGSKRNLKSVTWL